jgi:hypothetical protein
MAINFPGPYDLRFFYTCTSGGVARNHVMKLNLDVDGSPTPGTAFSSITPVRRVGLTTDLAAAADAWAALWLAAYPSTAFTLSHVELWEYAPQSFDSQFVSTYQLNDVGVGGNTLTAAGQYIITFRTQEGGILKLSFMEPPILSGVTDPVPLAATGMQAIVDFVISDQNWIRARDTSYPFAAIAGFPGINERLFKDRFRP